MIKRMSDKYKVTCDRCGVTECCSGDIPKIIMGYNHVSFHGVFKVIKNGHVCDLCYRDFCDLADRFFDEVNNEGIDETKNKYTEEVK